MTQEDKELLLKDLCGRLLYDVKVLIVDRQDETLTRRSTLYPTQLIYLKENKFINEEDNGYWKSFKPYLRPMSSMGEEEREIYDSMFIEIDGSRCALFPTVLIDWLNAHHFDYRGLIEKGLAIEAPEDMYK